MILNKIINNLLLLEQKLTHATALSYYRNIGVDFGKEVQLVGWPGITLNANSIITIGDNCVLRSRSQGNAIGINHRVYIHTFRPGAKIIIGADVGMSGVSICAKEMVMIGRNCLLGANVVIADNDFHAIKSENRRYNRSDEDIPAREIIIGDNVWIGANCYIMKGVTIGDNSVIGAMSVVTKSVPANCIAAGNPARIIRHLQCGMDATKK